MKKFSILLVALTVLTVNAFNQAQKPTLMVIPSDNWCIENGFTQTYNNQGTEVVLPDYKKAVQNSSDLLLVIGKINTMMADRGFPLKNLETELKNIEENNALGSVSTSRSGSEITESPVDILLNTARVDIIIQITWNINQTGPQKSITFNMQGLDAYTAKQIAGAQGTGNPSFSAELPLLLEEAVVAHFGNFTDQLQSHFDDMFENGREIRIRFKIWDAAGIDMYEEYEYDGELLEINEHLENWVADNTVQSRYSYASGGDYTLFFDQVRIPLFSDKGRPIDARRWAGGIRKMLREEPFMLECKVFGKGLGEVWVIIGEK